MLRAHALVATLKKALKAQGLTYRDVGKALGLSEANVKRMFARESFTLARLDQVCQLMAMEIADLTRMMDAERRQLTELTEEQEQELVADTRLLVVAFLVVNGLTFDDIPGHFQLTEPEIIRCLAKLDRLKLVELLPGNRVKLLVSPRFTWRRHGPIQKYFTARLQEDFLNSAFGGPGETFVFLSGMLSSTSTSIMLQKIEQLASQFNELNQEDRHLPLHQRTGYSVILAMRPWRAEIFKDLRKDRRQGTLR
jgi:transcriptional regulator with XRE-family HTH domain